MSSRLFHTLNPLGLEPLFSFLPGRLGRFTVSRKPGGSNYECFQPGKGPGLVDLLSAFPISGDNQGIISGDPGS
jgi:hypothetical protein